MVKLSARALVLSLCLGLAFFAGQPVAAHRGGGGRKDGKKDHPGKGTSGGKQEDPRDTVKRVVNEAIGGNKGVGAALIRLVFHDCWVHGCDGSVLVDTKPYGSKAEKEAENNIGLAGFDVIDKIKSQLAYPEKISCADIVVLAAREATFTLSRGKIVYDVNTGRTDGVNSSASAADAVLPPSTFNFEQLKANFKANRFGTKELVALSGAHVIGVARKSSFADRIKDDTFTPISIDYMKALKEDVKKQPIQPNNIRDKEFDFRNQSRYDATGVDTSMAARGDLDNSYYHANLQNTVLFRSDWELRNDTSGEAGGLMETFKRDPTEWYKEFGKAMAKLSDLLGVYPAAVNRTNCRVINTNTKY